MCPLHDASADVGEWQQSGRSVLALLFCRPVRIAVLSAVLIGELVILWSLQ